MPPPVSHLPNSTLIQAADESIFLRNFLLIPVFGYTSLMPAAWIDFSALKDAARFEPVLAHYGIRLIGSGAERSALCPFHDEKNPSFRVHLERKIFNCFGCGEKGNILDFVAKLENVPLKEAAYILAEYSGIDMREGSTFVEKRAKGQTPRKKPLQSSKTAARSFDKSPRKSASGNAPEVANVPLSFTLENLDPEHPYIRERGLPPEIIQTFGLGFCAKGIMRGRIAIPIHNEKGELVAYAGRWPGEPPEGIERYMLPRKFKKSQVLFNLHRVRGSEHIVLVEGYFSVFRLAALQVPAVALMGTTLSDKQMELLENSGARRLTLLLDNDNPGRAAATKILPRLADLFFVRAPALPDEMAPDTIGEGILLKAIGDDGVLKSRG